MKAMYLLFATLSLPLVTKAANVADKTAFDGKLGHKQTRDLILD
jgi:hypothetical protein